MNVEGSSHSQPFPPMIGIDLGGTQLRVALLRGDQLISRAATLLGGDRTPESVLPRLQATIQQAINEANVAREEIAGLGVAMPGPLNNKTGVVYSPPNLPAWRGVPLRDILQKDYPWPVFIENDANAAALGENLFGAGRGSKNMVYLVIGTGIGSGIIADGRLMEGTNGSAGELGHTTIDWRGERCYCGNVGCLEYLVSGTAIARMANEAIAQGHGSDLLAFAQTMLEHLTTVPDKSALPKQSTGTAPLEAERQIEPMSKEIQVTAATVGRAAEAGIPLARELINRAAEALGVGLVNVLHIFNPEIIVLGGGVMQLGSLLLEPALHIVRERATAASNRDTLIVQSQLNDNAGLIGAGALSYYYQNIALKKT